MWLYEVNSDCGLKTRGVPETDASLRNKVEAAKPFFEYGDVVRVNWFIAFFFAAERIVLLQTEKVHGTFRPDVERESNASHDIAKKQMEQGNLDQALKTVKL